MIPSCQYYNVVGDPPARQHLQECGQPAAWLRLTDLPGISPKRLYCPHHKDLIIAKDIAPYTWRPLES